MLEFYILLINVIHGCSVTVGNYKYNLSYLDAQGVITVSPPSDEPDIGFKVAFCSDKISCQEQTGILYRNDTMFGCSLYAMWDTSVEYEKTSNGFAAYYISTMICTENFEYLTSSFYYLCDKKSGHLGEIEVSKSGTSICDYDVNVYTDLVCNGSSPAPHPSPSPSGANGIGMSGGTIFLIILLAILCVYLLVGLSMKYHQDKVCEIPHREFWCWHLPLWTTVGCITSWRSVKSCYGRCCRKMFKTDESDERMATGLMKDQDQ